MGDMVKWKEISYNIEGFTENASLRYVFRTTKNIRLVYFQLVRLA